MRRLLVAAVATLFLLPGTASAGSSGITVGLTVDPATPFAASPPLRIDVTRSGGTGADAQQIRVHLDVSEPDGAVVISQVGGVTWDNGKKTIGHVDLGIVPNFPELPTPGVLHVIAYSVANNVTLGTLTVTR